MAWPLNGPSGHLFAVTNSDGATLTLRAQGRDLWALECLLAAGEAGCTPIDQPSPRWSACVFNLRQMGVEVQTLHEPHGPPFSGHHARYVLRSRVEPLQGHERSAA